MKKTILLFLPLLLVSCHNDSFSSNFSETVKSEVEESILQSSEESSSSLKESSNVLESDSSSLSVDNISTNVSIDLSNGKINGNNGNVIINENKICITSGGVYEITGSTDVYRVVVDAKDKDKVELDLNNVNISSNVDCPLLILNADKCEISAKKNSNNFITDLRSEDVEYEYNSAIYSTCDLQIKGKGTLNVESNSNNGIHTKDDLEIKNLSLNVKAVNNALKGNDSLTITSGNIKAISTKGDALKTTNTSISSKGNQKGSITLSGGTIDLYAACDAIDAAYDVIIEQNVVLNCFTESYSPYSLDVSIKDDNTKLLYLSLPQSLSLYTYKAIFYLDDDSSKEVYAKYVQSGGFSRYTYYSLDVPTNAISFEIYAYSDETFKFSTERQNLNSSHDCLEIRNSNGGVKLSWTDYKPSFGGPGGPGGPGGMQDGNPDKSEYSCKGIKADNIIIINGGTINIKSHDDAIHADNNATLENGEIGAGNVIINGGMITIYSDDDGIHADYKLDINDGKISIVNSYEGLEGNIITIAGGIILLKAKDDGINATTERETALLNINGGIIYVDANGDGIDSNGNIKMTGGYVIATGPTNGGNGVLDYDKTFTATGGYLLAIGCSGMNQKVSASGDCKSSTKSISTSIGSYVTLIVDDVVVLAIKVTKSSQNYCAYSYVGNNGVVNVSQTSELNFENDYYCIAL